MTRLRPTGELVGMLEPATWYDSVGQEERYLQFQPQDSWARVACELA